MLEKASQIKCVFQKVDKDCSGYITKDEIEELLYETYGYPALEEEVKMFMKVFPVLLIMNSLRKKLY